MRCKRDAWIEREIIRDNLIFLSELIDQTEGVEDIADEQYNTLTPHTRDLLYQVGST